MKNNVSKLASKLTGKTAKKLATKATEKLIENGGEKISEKTGSWLVTRFINKFSDKPRDEIEGDKLINLLQQCKKKPRYW